MNNSIGSGTLAPNSEKTCTVVVYWPSSDIDNTYNANGEDETAPTTNLSISLNATQAVGEEDSFGTDYDAHAVWQ